MANSGPDSNTSGFFICFAKTEWNDGKHVAFGGVAKGMAVLKAIEAVGTQDGPPSKTVTITACGEVNDLPRFGSTDRPWAEAPTPPFSMCGRS